MAIALWDADKMLRFFFFSFPQLCLNAIDLKKVRIWPNLFHWFVNVPHLLTNMKLEFYLRSKWPREIVWCYHVQEGQKSAFLLLSTIKTSRFATVHPTILKFCTLFPLDETYIVLIIQVDQCSGSRVTSFLEISFHYLLRQNHVTYQNVSSNIETSPHEEHLCKVSTRYLHKLWRWYHF